jgi:hypothetical protein
MTANADSAGVQVGSRPAFHISRSIANVIPLFVALAVAISLVFGWLERDEEYLTPKSGLGYWLGIYGSCTMLLLLIYSFRKRAKAARLLGSIPLWFRLHMLLGSLGPVLILFHSNFSLGSLNSNVALFTMLTVASSGVVGRYLYSKIHMGLYGQKAEAKEIIAEAEALRQSLGHEFEAADYVAEQLNAFSQRVLASPPTTLFSSLRVGAVLSVQTRFMRVKLLAETRRLLRAEGQRRGWSRRDRRERLARISEIIRLYFGAVLKAAEFAFFERLFAFWHVLHLPLFFLMLMAGVVHVWAVHHF